MTAGLSILEKNKNSSGFKIQNMSTLNNEGVITIQIQFTEASGNPKSSKINYNNLMNNSIKLFIDL